MTTIPKYSAEHAAAREQLLNGAIAAGKILPHRFQYWAAQYDADPQGTANVIAQLAACFRRRGHVRQRSYRSARQGVRVLMAHAGRTRACERQQRWRALSSLTRDRLMDPRNPQIGQVVHGPQPLVGSDLGAVRLEGVPSDAPRDPSWIAPATKGWDPNAPQGPYNPGGPFWRPC